MPWLKPEAINSPIATELDATVTRCPHELFSSGFSSTVKSTPSYDTTWRFSATSGLVVSVATAWQTCAELLRTPTALERHDTQFEVWQSIFVVYLIDSCVNTSR